MSPGQVGGNQCSSDIGIPARFIWSEISLQLTESELEQIRCQRSTVLQ